MRLLLLLSALLGALTGVAGTRVAAQPVQASARIAAVAGAATVAIATQRFVAAPYAALPPLTLGAPRPVSAMAARILYAERRRQ